MKSDLRTQLRLFPRLATGEVRPAAERVQAWAMAAWLAGVELRAFIEDLQGGDMQPELRQVVKFRCLELIAVIDALLRGVPRPAGEHALALALEYGLSEVVIADGPGLIEALELDEPLGEATASIDGVEAFFDALVSAFPGQLPNPLEPQGQGETIRALQLWSKLCDRTGTDAKFLKPLLEEA